MPSDKIMQAIRKDQVGIDARRRTSNRDKARESGFGDGVSLGTGRWRYVAGQWVNLDEQAVPFGEIRNVDGNKPCVFSGCNRAQVADFNKTFGHLGVTYQPDGKAVYRDYQSKKRVLQARGMIDRDGTWSGKNA